MSNWKWADFDKYRELENSNKVLTDELAETKRAFLLRESQLRELQTKLATAESKLRSESFDKLKKVVEQQAEYIEGMSRSVLSQIRNIGESHDLELGWNCAFGFLGEAIRCESVVTELCDKHNESVLAYKAEKKLRAEASAQLSGLNDTVDSIAFELNQVKRERDEAVQRSQRQAARITDLEGVGESVLKMQDIILSARAELERYKP